MSDSEVRHLVYRRTAESGRPPRAAEAAAELGASEGEILAAFARLRERRLLWLAPESGEISMAPPFSAAPTGFLVRSEDVTYYANCVWDAYGIPAALGRDAEVEASCGCCGEPMRMAVENGAPVATPGLAHFAVPAAHWWDDLTYT